MPEIDNDKPPIYNIKKVTLSINSIPIEDGIGEDGFGITPSGETEVIKGLLGEVGFAIDPSDGAEATLSLNATSPHNAELRNIVNLQRVGEMKSVPFEIIVEDDYIKAFGFKKKIIKHAVIVSHPEFKTDGKSAPQYEWKFVGFGYEETSVAAAVV